MLRVLLMTFLFSSLSIKADQSIIKETYREIGSGVLSFYFWDVYKVRYLKSKTSGNEAIELHYLRDIKKEYSEKGWSEALEHLDGIEVQKNWLIENSVDIKEDDILTIYKYSEENVLLTKNNIPIAKKLKDKKLFELIHTPWIGKKPINKELKAKLLKNE
ncbi:hypothetical protein BIY24_03900 [Halobacteriovorax marinus]|uniref:chalcone isomerase family protein n=1 Tax=Halobacteriovorax marinus TaxID=97084 RepID=UPI000BC2CC9C|nr:chalcone isomerase family protein [Halobacteriovorax marinus]ATH07110.1 hypothetical protein BIY24_03900 [Halobacteriovorax marinus]